MRTAFKRGVVLYSWQIIAKCITVHRLWLHTISKDMHLIWELLKLDEVNYCTRAKPKEIGRIRRQTVLAQANSNHHCESRPWCLPLSHEWLSTSRLELDHRTYVGTTSYSRGSSKRVLDQKAANAPRIQAQVSVPLLGLRHWYMGTQQNKACGRLEVPPRVLSVHAWCHDCKYTLYQAMNHTVYSPWSRKLSGRSIFKYDSTAE